MRRENRLIRFSPVEGCYWAWSRKRRLIWTKGDTVIQGIGQGYTQVTPLGLATTAIRIATGRAVQPHLTRAVSRTLYPVRPAMPTGPTLASMTAILQPSVKV